MYMPDRRFYFKSIFIVFTFVWLISYSGAAQNLSVQSPSDSLTVGEVFDFSITLNSQENFSKLIFPDSTYFNGDIEMVSSRQFRLSDYSDSTHYQLQFFGIENSTISPLPVRIVFDNDTTTIFTEPVQLLYKQTIASEEDPLKPIKPIFEFPRAIWPYIVGLVVLLLAAALIWYFFFRKQEVEETEPAPVPVFHNPLDELELRLEQLKADHESNIEKDYKDFYSRLGDAVRWYIEELYNIPALESTTREVLRFLDAFGVDVELIKHTRKILNEADMAKFAKFKPSLDQSWKAYNEGIAFLERAKVIDNDRIRRKRLEFFKSHNVTQEEKVNGMG